MCIVYFSQGREVYYLSFVLVCVCVSPTYNFIYDKLHNKPQYRCEDFTHPGSPRNIKITRKMTVGVPCCSVRFEN